MRKTVIVQWLTDAQIVDWMHQAETPENFQRRLAVRLVTLRYTIKQISSMLDVSETTVQRWIQSFNSTGPQGLAVGKRGGRRRSLLTLEQEKQLIHEWLQHAGRNAKTLQETVYRITGQQVSLKYAYDLIHRHEPKTAY